MPDFQQNADRFTGFAEVYDRARPTVPAYPVRVIRTWLGQMPDTVVDLGSGTGLSTLAWRGNCRRVIGVEPSDDMLAAARPKEDAAVSFRKGFGHDTGLPDACADAVTCSQSFHWMDPVLTLREVGRILRPGGVFATIDCDWPPVGPWLVEKAYIDLYNRLRALEQQFGDTRDSFIRYDKSKHLTHIRESGLFAYSREVVFSNTEPCDAERVIGLLMSQGSTQTLLRLHPDLVRPELDAYAAEVRRLCGDVPFEVDFCYRMRLGVREKNPSENVVDRP